MSKLRALKNILMGIGCFFGIHWEGVKGLGMFGDANACIHCKADRYGLLVVRGIAELGGPTVLETNK